MSIKKIIEETIKNKISESETRDYIGASLIGNDCERKIWYEYQGHEGIPISETLWLIFETGRQIEKMIVCLMKDSNMNIAENVPVNDSDIPWFKGHIDVVYQDESGKKHIVEIKSAKDSSFNLFKKNGLKKWNPQYFSQVQSYMGMYKIFSAVIFVLNKDNSLLAEEWIEFDAYHYDVLRQKAMRIREASEPPSRISNSPVWFQCKMCKFREICHS